ARFHHPSDRPDFQADAARRGLARAGRRAPAQRRDFAARCPAVADFESAGRASGPRTATGTATRAPAAPDRGGRARRGPSLRGPSLFVAGAFADPSLAIHFAGRTDRARLAAVASAEPRLVGFRDRRDRRAPERARCAAAARDAAPP